MKSINKSEQLPYTSDILQNQTNLFISKRNIILEYSKYIREDILALMKSKAIGWTEICRKLKSINYIYNPNSLQVQVRGKATIQKDISYFIPILIFLKEYK